LVYDVQEAPQSQIALRGHEIDGIGIAMKNNQSSKAPPTTDGMKIVAQAWDNREGPAVLAMVDASKMPNAIYVGEIRYVPGEGLLLADNCLCKTRANIQNGTKGAVLFLTKERKSFQVKGPLTYHTAGPIFETMGSWHDPKYPGVAAVLLRVEEAYTGAEKLL
jgi:predicted pyridoxine 5'-phosphate oxidase superfamily flavin-nucleotide-binding protein